VAQISGSPHSQAERLRDFEAGYRAQMAKRLSLDVTGFSAHYHNLTTVDAEAPYFTSDPAPPHLVLPSVFANSAAAHTYGIEFFANWNAASWWRISPGYSALHLNISAAPGAQSLNLEERADNSPENQAQVRSLIDLPRNFEWDTTAFYVGRLRDGGDGPVPAYVRLDTRLGWRPKPSLEFSIAGQNLLTPLHAEFHNAYEVRRSLVERSVFGGITWHF
jgi:iron complex outermembrane receptor protein